MPYSFCIYQTHLWILIVASKMNTYDTGDAKYMNLMVLKKMLILNTLQDGTHVIHFRSEKLHHPHKQKQTRQKYELVQ